MALHRELEANAQRILDEAGTPWRQVVDVDADAILYVNRLGKPRTLWLLRQEGTGRLRTKMVEGFPPFPPEGFAL